MNELGPDWEEYEKFHRIWESCQRSSFCGARVGKDVAYYVQFESKRLRILLCLILGPRGALHEKLVIVDPTKRRIADRVVRAHLCNYEHSLLDLEAIRAQIENGGEPAEICKAALFEKMERALRTPGAFNATLPGMELPPVSFGALQGGAIGQGRRGR